MTPKLASYLLYITLLLCKANSCFAQKELNFPEVRFGPELIKANWITHPEISGSEDATILFRNTFTLEKNSEDFIINISADNHYFLYVNNKLVTHGPQLSDIQHWKYETLNLKEFLQVGQNTIAVKVVNFGKRRFLGFQSIFTSLLVNGVSDNAKIVSTKGEGDHWKCFFDHSYKAIEVNWRNPEKSTIIGGFYANNPTDYVDFNLYPSAWQAINFDDSEWISPVFYESGSSMGGSIAYLLEARNLPLLTWEKETIGKIRRGDFRSSNFPEQGNLKIGKNKTVRFLLDNEVISNGFPELHFTGGKNAKIKISYAENLFADDKSKGDRNDIEDKELVGYYDFIISNGKENQVFIPNWMRTYRFIQFDIETENEDLFLNNFFNNQSRTTIPSVSTFETDHETYNKIFEICKRTVDICTQDYFLSDAYYETMQYVGDSKIQALLWQDLSGNLAHTENAIRQFDQSRDAEGNILGSYPMRSTFIYPTYSLVWVDMIDNYFNLTQDKAFIKSYQAGIKHTLSGFEKNMTDINLVDKTPYRYFVDWYSSPNNGKGTAIKNDGLHSAVVSLHYAYTLKKAAKLMQSIEDKETSKKYLQRAKEIIKAVNTRCYNEERGLYAENPTLEIYDQHTNIMAILTDALPKKKQENLLIKLLEEPNLLQASYYYRYYLFLAIDKLKAYQHFDQALKPWQELINWNMSTTLERLETPHSNTRSEVHPWSSSPLHFFYLGLAGIKSTKHNYEELEISPAFGNTKKIKGQLAIPQGILIFNMRKTGNSLKAEIELPKGCSGSFIWNGKKQKLKAGVNHLSL